MPPQKPPAHKWHFPTRIRPNTFTWRSSATAVARIKAAVPEITSVARTNPATASHCPLPYGLDL